MGITDIWKSQKSHKLVTIHNGRLQMWLKMTLEFKQTSHKLQLTNDSGNGIEDGFQLWIDDWSRLTIHNGNVIQNDFRF